MRIKFRAWYEEKQKYVEPALIDYAGNTYEVSDKQLSEHSCNIVGKTNLQIEQFTGLYDKNGKEIYTGDILAFDKDFDDTTNTFIVYFDEKIAKFNFKIYGYADYISESGSLEYENSKSVIGETEECEREDILLYLEYVSIIGNIHETNMEEILNEAKK